MINEKKRFLLILQVVLLTFALILTPFTVVASPEKDVSAKVQLLGNPFSNKKAYARNVWDMHLYNNFIYFGIGNSSNYGPAPNSGPIDVIKYDPLLNEFINEYTVNEEQIEIYRTINNKLYIPGHDPLDSWELGNFYLLDAESGSKWIKTRTIPNAIHTYDMTSYNGKLYAATGINGISEVLSSQDEGLTWQSVFPSGNSNFLTLSKRAYSLVKFKDTLYASSVFTTAKDYSYNNLLKISGDKISVLKISSKKMFPGISNINIVKFARTAVFNDKFIYTIGKVVNDHQCIPMALYYSSEIGVGNEVTLPNNKALPYDILVRNSMVYVLASVKHTKSAYTNVVYSSKDMKSWTEVLCFSGDTFARSFEELNGDFYFGLGCDTDNLPESTGNILKVSEFDY